MNLHHHVTMILVYSCIVNLIGCNQDPTGISNENTPSHLSSIIEEKKNQGQDVNKLLNNYLLNIFKYDQKKLLDPFVDYRKLNFISSMTTKNANNFNLDNVQLVGTVEVFNKRLAFIQDSNLFIHKVKLGDVIGKNKLKVININTTSVEFANNIKLKINY